MCIGCQRRRKKEEMLRFIQRRNGAVFPIEKKWMHGRSFYLCPDLICLKMAQKKGRWVGSLESIDLLYPLIKGLA